jgi:hypothetical protein
MRRYLAHATLAILTAAIALPAAVQAQNTREPGNVVGGGFASMSGGGDDTTITYSIPGAGQGACFGRNPGGAPASWATTATGLRWVTSALGPPVAAAMR